MALVNDTNPQPPPPPNYPSSPRPAALGVAWVPPNENYLAIPQPSSTPPPPPSPPAAPTPLTSMPNVAQPTKSQTPLTEVEKAKSTNKIGKDANKTFPKFKPGERLVCCETKTTVIIANSIAFLYSLVYIGWNGFVGRYANAALAGLTILLCLCVYLNLFVTKSAAVYVVMATTMAIVAVASYGLQGQQYYNAEYFKRPVHELRLPGFEGVIVDAILVVGLVQMYRFQNYCDALDFVRRNAINRLRDSLRSIRSLRSGRTPKTAVPQV